MQNSTRLWNAEKDLEIKLSKSEQTMQNSTEYQSSTKQMPLGTNETLCRNNKQATNYSKRPQNNHSLTQAMSVSE